MTTPTVGDRVRTLISVHLAHPLDEVIDTADMIDDLGADSLDNIELVMALEEEFDIEIPDDEADAAPKAAPNPVAPPKVSKGDIIIHLLYRPQGATNAEMRGATGWQSHTVRGFLGGVLRNKGIPTESAVEVDRGRVYRAMEAV